MDTSEDNYLTAPDKCLTEDEARAQCAFLTIFAGRVFAIANGQQTTKYGVMESFGEVMALWAEATDQALKRGWMLYPILDSIYKRALFTLRSHVYDVQNEEIDSMKLLLMAAWKLVLETNEHWKNSSVWYGEKQNELQ